MHSYHVVKFSSEKALGMYLEKMPCRVLFADGKLLVQSRLTKKIQLCLDSILSVEDIITLGQHYFSIAYLQSNQVQTLIFRVKRKDRTEFREDCLRLIAKTAYPIEKISCTTDF